LVFGDLPFDVLFNSITKELVNFYLILEAVLLILLYEDYLFKAFSTSGDSGIR